MQRIFKQFHKKISGLLIFSLLVLSVSFSPIPTPHIPNSSSDSDKTFVNEAGRTIGIHKVEAFGGGPVTVVGGTGTIQETISAGANTLIAGLQNAFFIKEFTMDGILHGLAKMVLKSMTQSLLNWINSGFQGSPAFVTDLKQFMRDRIDTVVGDYIYNDPSLNFLCSPFELDVKIALATTYQEQAYESGSEAQCTLSDVEDNIEGFLSGDSFDPATWLEVTQNPSNTPTGAYLAAEGEMYARIADEEGRTVQELEWGQGFLSFKVCSDTDVANGTQTDCDITTPGQVIADQINRSLGAGQDALIEADEINEIIGALFAQLAKQAITGVYGLLGLGGGTGYSNSNFGPDGDQSYLDALDEEGTGSDSVTNPLEAAVLREEEHIDLQSEAVSMVNDVEATLEAATNQHGSCIGLTFPESLEEERDEAIAAIITSNQAIPILITLRDRFASSTDPQEQLDIINTYEQLQSSGVVIGVSENNLLEVHIDFELNEEVENFRTQITDRRRVCEIDR